MLLQDTAGLDELAAHRLNEVVKSVAHMSALIDGLLDLSQTVKQVLRMQPVDMGALALDVVQELGEGYAGTGTDWNIGPLPVIRGDPVLLRQVWVNLLSNARKYSSRRPMPKVEIGTQAGGPGETVFFVRDNGVGFDQKFRFKLFNAFQRLHGAGEFEGTGIGLEIVRRVIDRHGGRCWAEGEVDQGATFYFSISTTEPMPVAPADAE